MSSIFNRFYKIFESKYFPKPTKIFFSLPSYQTKTILTNLTEKYQTATLDIVQDTYIKPTFDKNISYFYLQKFRNLEKCTRPFNLFKNYEFIWFKSFQFLIVSLGNEKIKKYKFVWTFIEFPVNSRDWEIYSVIKVIFKHLLF